MMLLVKCKICGELKTEDMFRQLHGKRRGYICKACHADRCRDQNRDHKRVVRSDPNMRAKELSDRRAVYKDRYESDPGYADKLRAKSRAQYRKLTEQFPERLAEHRERNKVTNRMGSVRRRVARRLGEIDSGSALPEAYSDPRIKSFYAACPNDMTVDHIIPIGGDTVSGLHVPWNLQYLPMDDNIRKNNRFDAESYDAWVEGGEIGAFLPASHRS